jgi:hypothetical protein
MLKYIVNLVLATVRSLTATVLKNLFDLIEEAG